MRKLLTAVVAALFAASTGTVFAASHAGAKMDDKEKKTETKSETKTDSKKDEKKPTDVKK